MSRLYTISFADVSVSANQDLINVTATSGMAFAIHRFVLNQKTLTSQEAKGLLLKRFPATVTAGSGGSAATPQKLNYGDAAATITARVNDTTGMTTNGTASTLYADEWQFLLGVDHVFAPNERPVIAPSQGCALILVTSPSGSMTVSGTMIVEELF